MKILAVLFFAFSILTVANAQTKVWDSKTELLSLLKSKLDYERMIIANDGKDTSSYKKKIFKFLRQN